MLVAPHLRDWVKEDGGWRTPLGELATDDMFTKLNNSWLVARPREIFWCYYEQLREPLAAAPMTDAQKLAVDQSIRHLIMNHDHGESVTAHAAITGRKQ